MQTGSHHRLHRRGAGRALRVLDLLRRADLLPAPGGQARRLSARVRPRGRPASRSRACPRCRRRRPSCCRTAASRRAPRRGAATAGLRRRCRSAGWPGAPLEPTGNPMLDGVGPAAYALRADTPDLTFEAASTEIVPLRVAADHLDRRGEPRPARHGGRRRRRCGRRHRERPLGRSRRDADPLPRGRARRRPAARAAADAAGEAGHKDAAEVS